MESTEPTASNHEARSSSVIAVVDDLFFASKIRGTAEALGVTVSFARHCDGVKELIQRTAPRLIICDLHSEKLDVISLAKALKSDPATERITLLGFFSHVQTELQENAMQAGFDQVIPRSAFAKNLISILQEAG